MSRVSIKSLEWDHRYVAIFKCHRQESGYGVEELKVAGHDEIESDSDLQRVLGALQRDLIDKRMYKLAQNPTSRLLTFRSCPDEQENEGRKHLNALLRAKGMEEVHVQGKALADRYKGIPNIREGILIFLISRGTLDHHVAENCAFIFKCDFEAVSQVTPAELFRRVDDAIVEQTKKAALYPYFHQRNFDDTTIRVFDELGQTQYWLEFLGLGERAPEHVSLQDAVVARLPGELASRYAEYFETLPRTRPLADDKGRRINREDRLPTSEIQDLNDKIVGEAGRQTVTLRLDEVGVTAPLHQYGRMWIIAEEEGERYILIKGSGLESRTRMLTPIDLADFPSLEEAMAELGI